MPSVKTEVPLSAVKPETYPTLSREGVGILKFAWRKARVKDDWTKGGFLSEAWDRTTGWPYWKKPTYDMDYMTRVIAKIAQEVPAWREVCSDTVDKYTMRWPQYAGWFDWVEEKGLDPKAGRYPLFYYRHLIPPGFAGVYNTPGYAGNGYNSAFDEILASIFIAPRRTPPAQHPYYPQRAPATEEHPMSGRVYDPDPIYGNGSSNMMYKGYFAHCLMHSYLISGDDKYLQPLRLVYDDDIQYTYSVEQMCQIMCEQHLGFLDPNGSPLLFGIDCEVGKSFPVCITVGGLATHLHDKLFETNYRAGYDKWRAWFKDNMCGGNTEPEGPFAWCAPYVDRDIPYVMDRPEQQMGVLFTYTALQLSPLEPEHALRIYEGSFKNWGREEDNGLHLIWNPAVSDPFVLDDRIANSGALAMAHEFNDVERLEGLRAWFEAEYGPTFKDGEFYFTFGIEESWPRGIPNEWAMLAYIGEPGSFRRMYNEINLDKFSQPTVEGVDYPNLAVRQAYYDATKDALIVGTTVGVGRRGARTTFRVTNLSLGGGHELVVDGHPSAEWAPLGPGEILVQTTIDDHTFVIR